MLDGEFNAAKFNDWLQQVKVECAESSHLSEALSQIGSVLIHAPADPDGLWMHRTIAQALNEPDADSMRSGYSFGAYKARGAHWVDPTGAPEKALDEQFREKAEAIENAGYHRFAITLRQIAKGYDRDAQRIIQE